MQEKFKQSNILHPSKNIRGKISYCVVGLVPPSNIIGGTYKTEFFDLLPDYSELL